MKPLRWLKERVKHKLEHFSKDSIKKFLKENGLAFVVIFVAWEIIEDVLFPLLFIWLGNNVNPWWLSGAPISWLLCLHPVAVPALWWLWLKIRRNKQDSARIFNSGKGVCNEDHTEES